MKSYSAKKYIFIAAQILLLSTTSGCFGRTNKASEPSEEPSTQRSQRTQPSRQSSQAGETEEERVRREQKEAAEAAKKKQEKEAAEETARLEAAKKKKAEEAAEEAARLEAAKKAAEDAAKKLEEEKAEEKNKKTIKINSIKKEIADSFKSINSPGKIFNYETIKQTRDNGFRNELFGRDLRFLKEITLEAQKEEKEIYDKIEKICDDINHFLSLSAIQFKVDRDVLEKNLIDYQTGVQYRDSEQGGQEFLGYENARGNAIRSEQAFQQEINKKFSAGVINFKYDDKKCTMKLGYNYTINTECFDNKTFNSSRPSWKLNELKDVPNFLIYIKDKNDLKMFSGLENLAQTWEKDNSAWDSYYKNLDERLKSYLRLKDSMQYKFEDYSKQMDALAAAEKAYLDWWENQKPK